MMVEEKTMWVFHGSGGRFASGVFSSVTNAECWIKKHKLTGVLTEYPIDQGIYDWTIDNHIFAVQNNTQATAGFIQKFTSGSQCHFHYEDGEKDS